MSEEIEKLYDFDPLEKYSLRDRTLIRVADVVFYLAIKVIGSTIRWEVAGEENLNRSTVDGRQPIYCLWHDRIFAGTFFLRNRGIVVITSQSLDGEYIARFLKRFGFGTVRGSSSRGGVKALVGMIRLMRSGIAMAFTVDGPRGPRYVAKTGAILLAKKTGNPIIPFSVECSHYWTVKSWDRMQIPKPFTRALFVLGEPVEVAAGTEGANLEMKRVELQQGLEHLVERGVQWRNDG